MLKVIKDIFSVLYDADGCMSIARLLAVISSVCVIISWICTQFYGYQFEGFSYLCGLAITWGGAYGWKKYNEVKKD
jgi:hypothetical protein